MKTYFSLFILLYFAFVNSSSAQSISSFEASPSTDSLIRVCLNEINADSIHSYIQSLQDLGTRYAYADNHREVAQWIVNKFKSFGYEKAHVDSFVEAIDIYMTPFIHYNAVCNRSGNGNTNNLIIIGAHHDAVEISPGADDNASGTAGVLELARVMAAKHIETNHPLKFITFTAEEQGLYGSNFDANETVFENIPVDLMLDMDMISTASSDSLSIYSSHYKKNDTFLEPVLLNAGKYYSGMEAIYDGYNSYSDHYPYGEKGIPILYFEEYEPSPVYHSMHDSINYTNSIYASRIVKTTAASLLIFDWFPQTIDIQYANSGNGSSVNVYWSSIKNAKTYHLFLFSGGLTVKDEITTDTSLIITDLLPGLSYQAILSVTNLYGNTMASNNLMILPDSIPQAPTGLLITGLTSSFHFEWHPNPENDILGYNLFEEFTDGSPSNKITDLPIRDTYFDIDQISDNEYHYYRMKAVDQSRNESGFSKLVSSKPGKDTGPDDSIELLVIIDLSSVTEYKDQFISFFENTLINQPYTLVTLLTNLPLSKTQILSSKKIIWVTPFPKSTSNAFENNYPLLLSYLKSGGKLLLSTGNANITTAFFDRNFPSVIPETNPSYTFLKTAKVDYSSSSWFNGALASESSYPDLDLDAESVPSELLLGTNLRLVQSIQPNNQAEVIYSYRSPLPNDSIFGSMNNSPVGFEYLGNDYDFIFLSFPIVFMKQEHASKLFSEVLTRRFSNSTVAIHQNARAENENLILWPNPANTYVSLSFQGNSKNSPINIYSSIGKLIYSSEFTTTNSPFNLNISNWNEGVYLVSVTCDGQAFLKKMVIVHE